ncbi:hypothetical protein K435DRAFT_806724 [Dendrothele bispora CBS 962.96]|uniref:Uncharacterized protein n=1 Tax=Dendrothele bispora (strain CBS 962.96) TaxID=1314807 RepID=A0A4S8L7C9_DENBC|nr:hypothetical protein K435DRAFT_806724 [Dendrothele bispora CBS 962.96]
MNKFCHACLRVTVTYGIFNKNISYLILTVKPGSVCIFDFFNRVIVENELWQDLRLNFALWSPPVFLGSTIAAPVLTTLDIPNLRARFSESLLGLFVLWLLRYDIVHCTGLVRDKLVDDIVAWITGMEIKRSVSLKIFLMQDCWSANFYYIAFPNDRLIIKTLVYGCFVLNTAQTILNVIDAFNIFGSGFGDLDSLMDMRRAGISVPILTGLVSCSVQFFYGYQIYILSRSKALAGIIYVVMCSPQYQYPGIVALLAQWLRLQVAQPPIPVPWYCGPFSPVVKASGCTGALVEGAYVYKINNLFTFQRETFIECTIWLAGSALCDTLIAVSMTIYLHRTKPLPL